MATTIKGYGQENRLLMEARVSDTLDFAMVDNTYYELGVISLPGIELSECFVQVFNTRLVGNFDGSGESYVADVETAGGAQSVQVYYKLTNGSLSVGVFNFLGATTPIAPFLDLVIYVYVFA